jgi:hypothetical protein
MVKVKVIERDSVESLEKFVLEAKKRMLEWPNPVEYVNNMYGTHPDGWLHRQYFLTVFGGLDSKGVGRE